jgi:hypothetical protein
MEARMVLNEILERTQESIWTVPEAPRSIGRIAEYRGKVYLALLHLERERVSVAPSKWISASREARRKWSPDR